MTVSMLCVVLNKWATVDASGNPKGVCIRDPKITRGSRDYIGMNLNIEESVLPNHIDGEKEPEFGRTYGPGTLRPKGAKETVSHAYVNETVSIENTPFHRERIRHGDLFAADRATFKAVFSTVDGFEEPASMLEKARLRALNHVGLTDDKIVEPVDDEPKASDDSGAPAPPTPAPTTDGTTSDSEESKPAPTDDKPRKPPGRTPPIVPNTSTVKE